MVYWLLYSDFMVDGPTPETSTQQPDQLDSVLTKIAGLTDAESATKTAEVARMRGTLSQIEDIVEDPLIKGALDHLGIPTTRIPLAMKELSVNRKIWLEVSPRGVNMRTDIGDGTSYDVSYSLVELLPIEGKQGLVGYKDPYSSEKIPVDGVTAEELGLAFDGKAFINMDRKSSKEAFLGFGQTERELLLGLGPDRVRPKVAEFLEEQVALAHKPAPTPSV